MKETICAAPHRPLYLPRGRALGAPQRYGIFIERTGKASMPGSPNSTLLAVFYVGLLALGLSACGGSPDGIEDSRRHGTKGDINRQINQGLGGRTREDGSLFGPGGLFGSKPK